MTVIAGLRQDAESLEGWRRDVSGLVGAPQAGVRVKDAAEVPEVLRWAAGQGMAVLPVGAQTSTTGASVPTDGLVLDLSALEPEPRLDTEALTVTVGAGTRVRALRDLLQRAGYDLPVDPTSEAECTLGGAIATNASGASSFRYGAMGRWVQALELVDGRGERLRLSRRRVSKCAMGPVALQDPIAFLAGSEGTLGVITGATLRIIPAPTARVGVWVPFARRPDLIAGAHALAGLRDQLPVRCVEWLDGPSCQLLAPHAAGLKLLTGEAGGLYVEVEGQGAEAEAWEAIEQVADLLAKCRAQAEHTLAFQDPAERRHFGSLRHRVPDTMNRRGRRLAEDAGGGKLSTDWSVPLPALEPLLRWTDHALADLPLQASLAYGHIGDGHPHLNLLCPDAATRDRARQILAAQLQRVVDLDGSPVSEHGIGKIKRDLIAPHLAPGFVEAWRGLKARFDPDGLLGRGNLTAA